MNIQYQRHSDSLQTGQTGQTGWRYLRNAIGTASLLGIWLAISAISEPLINRDRSMAFAQDSNSLAQISDILAQATFGDDQLTRYAAAANAIENKRLEIFRAAKNNSNWIDVANLAETKHTKVCDLSKPPVFLIDLCSQLRSFTEKEIRRQGFTNKEFNQITREQRQNPYLRGLIQSKQMQLRNSK